MKRNKIKLLTVILALLLLLSGCINPEPEEEEGTTAPIDVSQIDKNSIGSYKTMQYTYLTDVDPATLTTGFDPTYLLLVNKQSELDVGYVPANLVTLTCATTRSMQLEARAAQALYAMMAEMNAAGIKDVMVTSAYRSYEYQQDLYDKYLNDERRGISEDASRVLGEEYIKANYLDKKIFKLSFEDALKVVQSYSALPGQSEHQTGLCLDFIT
ncbi:MAG: D-alanyl-D-alanine carboxypeptidase family protein, partial [Clostridia bacterium]|nr:D-alanyl-D-alanine carboxypeptidase family protein [Clostridia bacterium]